VDDDFAFVRSGIGKILAARRLIENGKYCGSHKWIFSASSK